MSKDITIQRPQEITARLLVISQEVLNAKDALLKKSKRIKDVTAKNYERASELFGEIHETIKLFDQNIKEATTPLQDFKIKIINLVKPHSEELTEEKKALAKKIRAYEIQVENARLEKERAERLEREEYERKKAEAEAEAKKTNDFPDLPDEPEPEPEPQLPAVQSKIKVKKLWTLKIVDLNKIPTAVEVDEETVMLLVPDEIAIKRVFRAGGKVPGCTWTQEENIGAK